MNQSQSISNRYDRRTIATMEIMSSYFVNIFYNSLYFTAKQSYEQRESQTITDGYKCVLQNWIIALESSQLYKQTIRELYNFYMQFTSYAKSWDEYIDDMVREFVPEDYMPSLRKAQKTGILSMVIKNSNMKFIQSIVLNHFPIIIDSHNSDNAHVLKSEMVGILLLEREQIYQHFVIQATEGKSAKGSSANSPDKLIIDNLRSQLRTSLKEKYELNKRLIKMRKIIIKNAQEIEILRSKLDSKNDKDALNSLHVGVSTASDEQSYDHSRLYEDAKKDIEDDVAGLIMNNVDIDSHEKKTASKSSVSRSDNDHIDMAESSKILEQLKSLEFDEEYKLAVEDSKTGKSTHESGAIKEDVKSHGAEALVDNIQDELKLMENLINDASTSSKSSMSESPGASREDDFNSILELQTDEPEILSQY
jgi:hypothetical protein